MCWSFFSHVRFLILLMVFELLPKTCNFTICSIFSNSGPWRPSSSVVRRKLFKKSSLLKVLDQWKPNLVWIITRVSSFKIVSGDAVPQPTWTRKSTSLHFNHKIVQIFYFIKIMIIRMSIALGRKLCMIFRPQKSRWFIPIQGIKQYQHINYAWFQSNV
jgi:hypothetical protein